MKYKQVIVVRTDLNMSIGKLAGQVAHASVNAVLDTDDNKVLNAWFNEGHKKVICKVKSEKALTNIWNKVVEADIPSAAILDYGLTEIEPNTFTAVGIGPATNEEIDMITKRLSLL